MIDNTLIELYKEEVASEMDEKELYVNLMVALEGEEVQRERALALVYELRDRADCFSND